MAVSVIRLAQKKVLVQDMPAVEVLARVDTICVDKTGTLTEPGMRVRDVVPLGAAVPELDGVLGAMGASEDSPNPTLAAIAEHYPVAGLGGDRIRAVLERAQVVGGHLRRSRDLAARGTGDPRGGRRRRARGRPTSGRPTAPGCCCSHGRTGSRRPTAVRGRSTPAALVVINQQLRPDAAETVAYFLEQDVTVKVISGDNAATVGAIAQQAGRARRRAPRRRARPARPTPRRSAEVLAGANVFGRVTPSQKQQMVDALHAARIDGRDDRRRRQRRAGAQERRSRHRDGLRLGRHARRGPGGPARQPLVGHAERRRGGPPGPRQHRARLRRLPHQDQLRGDLLPRHRPLRRRLPVPAAPPDAHRRR